MTPAKMTAEEAQEVVQRDMQTRLREGMRALLEQILEVEMTEHVGAGPRERTPQRKGGAQRPL